MAGRGQGINTATARWCVALCLSLLVTACTAPAPLPLEEQAVDSAYEYAVPPSNKDGWRTQSLDDAGIRQRPLAVLVSRIRDNTFPRVYSVLLVKDGKLVFEEYFAGRHRYQARQMHSVSKSVTSILVGIAVDQGLIGVDDPVHTYFEDYRGLEWIDRPYEITIRDLLAMAHGTDWDERSRTLKDPKNSIIAMTNSEDWLRFTLGHKLVEPPGQRFNYAGGMTVLLGEIVSRASGQDLGDFAERNLFQPMGIHIEGWHRSRHGTVNAQGGLLLRPRDMAKIGQLMLDKGTWQGKGIVSEAWVREALTSRITAENGWGYGYLWRLGQAPVGDQLIDLFFAAGRGGQHIIVVPSLRLVGVFTAQPIDNPGGLDRNLIMMSDYILPAVTGAAAPRHVLADAGELGRYAGRYRHHDTGHEVTVAIDGTRLSISPSFWRRIPFSPIGSETFIGYWDRMGHMHARFLPGDGTEADGFVVRLLFGKRIYQRVEED
jgi:CubicO group peptidase (beta-lactamase class C family)